MEGKENDGTTTAKNQWNDKVVKKSFISVALKDREGEGLGFCLSTS